MSCSRKYRITGLAFALSISGSGTLRSPLRNSPFDAQQLPSACGLSVTATVSSKPASRLPALWKL
jgi:hypothetical protein